MELEELIDRIERWKARSGQPKPVEEKPKEAARAESETMPLEVPEEVTDGMVVGDDEEPVV